MPIGKWLEIVNVPQINAIFSTRPKVKLAPKPPSIFQKLCSFLKKYFFLVSWIFCWKQTLYFSHLFKDFCFFAARVSTFSHICRMILSWKQMFFNILHLYENFTFPNKSFYFHIKWFSILFVYLFHFPEIHLFYYTL